MSRVKYTDLVLINRAGIDYHCTVKELLEAREDAKPSTVLDVKLYAGNGSTQMISGLGFSPGLVWLKSRSQAFNHGLYDTVRGATNRLISSSTNAEDSLSGVTAFNSDGFTMGGADGSNGNTYTYAAWTWDAGSSTSSNGSGSITSSVRANASAGFSVVSYTSNSSAVQTVGHGLNVAPAMIIWKDRDAATNWFVFHNGGTPYMLEGLNTTAAGSTSYANMNSTLPTSSVFTLNSGGYAINPEGNHAMVAYCWAPVAGYSSFGSFSAGQHVDCGFPPRLVMAKRADSAGDWEMVDTVRGSDKALWANSSRAEGAPEAIASLDQAGFVTKGSGSFLYAAWR